MSSPTEQAKNSANRARAEPHQRDKQPRPRLRVSVAALKRRGPLATSATAQAARLSHYMHATLCERGLGHLIRLNICRLNRRL